MIKVVCDASSRILIFGCMMFTANCWVFSTQLAVAYYYGMLALMLVANFTFCRIEKEKIWSLRNLIGKNILWMTFDNLSFYRNTPEQPHEHSEFQPF